MNIHEFIEPHEENQAFSKTNNKAAAIKNNKVAPAPPKEDKSIKHRTMHKSPTKRTKRVIDIEEILYQFDREEENDILKTNNPHIEKLEAEGLSHDLSKTYTGVKKEPHTKTSMER